MKTLFKFLGALAALIVIGIGAVFYFTSDMVDATDEFFDAVKSNNLDQAYTSLSEEFKAKTSRDDLVAFIEENSLNDYASANWSTRSIESGNGSISGAIITKHGGSVPLHIGFVKEQEDWKIYSMKVPKAGLQDENSTAQPPGDEKLVQLARSAMHEFALSVNDRSMQKFHSHISNLWQQQFSIQDLDNAYSAFYDAGIDLTVLDQMSPQFNNPPEIDTNGVLVVNGLYPTQPSQLHFEQKYIYEGLSWKLVGFSANIK